VLVHFLVPHAGQLGLCGQGTHRGSGAALLGGLGTGGLGFGNQALNRHLLVRGRCIPVDDLRDFVDRIEVIYAWSQFLRNPDADLPGGQVLEALLKADHWTFGGPAWRNRRKVREYSTAFSAPINYGPGLKMLGWVEPHKKYWGVLIASSAADPALHAFESKIKNQLDHPAFSKFGSVRVRAIILRAESRKSLTIVKRTSSIPIGFGFDMNCFVDD
jgi:hypothetical protein